MFSSNFSLLWWQPFVVEIIFKSKFYVSVLLFFYEYPNVRFWGIFCVINLKDKIRAQVWSQNGLNFNNFARLPLSIFRESGDFLRLYTFFWCRKGHLKHKPNFHFLETWNSSKFYETCFFSLLLDCFGSNYTLQFYDTKNPTVTLLFLMQAWYRFLTRKIISYVMVQGFFHHFRPPVHFPIFPERGLQLQGFRLRRGRIACFRAKRPKRHQRHHFRKF